MMALAAPFVHLIPQYVWLAKTRNDEEEARNSEENMLARQVEMAETENKHKGEEDDQGADSSIDDLIDDISWEGGEDQDQEEEEKEKQDSEFKDDATPSGGELVSPQGAGFKTIASSSTTQSPVVVYQQASGNTPVVNATGMSALQDMTTERLLFIASSTRGRGREGDEEHDTAVQILRDRAANVRMPRSHRHKVRLTKCMIVWLLVCAATVVFGFPHLDVSKYWCEVDDALVGGENGCADQVDVDWGYDRLREYCEEEYPYTSHYNVCDMPLLSLSLSLFVDRRRNVVC